MLNRNSEQQNWPYTNVQREAMVQALLRIQSLFWRQIAKGLDTIFDDSH